MTRFLAAAVLAALLLPGCHKKEKPAPPPPVAVVAHPLRQRIIDLDDYTGRFVSIDAVEIRPRVTGYLQKLYFRDGQRIRKGDPLFLVDPRPYEATLGQAAAQVARQRATLANAEVELKRSQALFEAKAGSEQDLQTRKATRLQAQADLAAAEANRRAAALNVEFTMIRAPLSGRISDRRAAPGNLVTADQTILTTIVNDDPIRFSFEASEALFLKRQRERQHQIGDPVEIRLADETEYRWHGKLEFLDNQLDVNSGVIRGRAVLANPNGFLAPGVYGHMRLPGSAPYEALLVPDSAVTSDQARQIVLVVGPDNVAHPKPVQTGPMIGGLRVIRQGIGPDDRVVVGNAVHVKPGMKVQPKNGRIERQKDAPALPYSSPVSSAASPA